MAKYSNTIEYNINTKLDSSGLVKLQAQIKQLENSMQQMSNRELLNSDKVQQAKAQLEGLNTALTNSFNSSLGILDLSKFRAELDSSGVSAVGLRSAFNMMGAEGQAALNGLTTQIANFNGGMERTSSAVDKIATTFGNTFRWGVIASFFSQFMNAIHSSIDYVKELDDSLTQIMLVTDYNRDSMNAYAKAANEAAKAVGQTTVGMTNASLIFAQQGYDLTQSQELATLSAKLANASQQDTATTSDQITAYMNAYGLSSSIEDLSSALDSWALVANVSAADVAELATASQKAASTANSVGVNMDQLNAQIATIESVTRDAPEQIGNGLKTLYARFSDIKLGKTLEDGVNLGQVTGQLNKLGVQVLDQFGNIRDVGDILEDLMVIWDDLDQTTKEASAQTLAGKFQMNRFLALMDNSDMYREYLGASENAEGTLDQMNEEYLDSLEGRTARIQASLEGIFSSIFDTDVVYPFIDAMQKFLDILQTLIDSLGGGSTIVLGLVSAFGQLFSQNIARGINDTLANRELMQIRQRNIEGVNSTLDRVGIDRNSGVGQYISNTAAQAKQGAINDVQYDTYMNNVQNWINASTALAKSEENLTDNINLTNAVFEKIAGVSQAITRDETGLNALSARQVSLNDKNVQLNLQSADFSEEAENARQVALALREVQVETQKTKINDEQLGTAIELVSDRFADLGFAFDTDRAEQIQFRLETIRKEIDESGEVSVNAQKEIQGYVTELEHLSENLIDLDSNSARKIIADAGRSAEKIETDINFNQTQVNRAEADADDSKVNIDSQQQIKQIIDVVGALGQLAFAIQSVQNLGSIWKNEDLTFEEKLLQTIINLSMVIPSIITTLQTLQKTQLAINLATKGAIAANGSITIAKEIEKKATEDLTKAEERLANARRMSVAGAEGERRASEIEAAKKEIDAAQKAAEDAVKNSDKAAKNSTSGLDGFKNLLIGLKDAFLALPIPVKIAIGALTAITAVLSVIVYSAAESRQAILDTFNDLTDRLENIDNSIENFETLKKTFDETGQVSDELKDSARKLAKELGVTGAEAYIAAGNFDLLAEKILAARDAQNQEVITQGAAAIEATSNDYGALNTFLGYNTSRQLENAVIGNSYVTAALQETSFSEEEDPTKKIGAIQQALQDLNEQFRQATPGTQEYTDLAAAINLLNEALEKENVSTIIEQAEAMKEAALASSDFSEGLKAAAEQGPAAMRAFIESYDGLIPYLNILANPDSFISGLMTDYGTQYNDLFSILGDLNEAGKRTINLENLPKDFDPTKYSNLSQEDWEALGFSSYEAFLGAFNRAQKYQPLEIKPVLEDDMLHYSEDEITEIMNRAGLEGISLDDYVQSFKVSGGAGINSGEVNTLSEEVDSLTLSVEEASKALSEMDENDPNYSLKAKEVEVLETELDTARDRMEQLAIAALETSNGMDELSENWKDINDSIENGNPGEVAAGYSQLKNILAQILNVDPSAITQGFMESEEVLAAIADLANGDTEAIYRLREAFADPLTVQTYLDTIGFQGDTDKFLDLVRYAQDALPDLEVGASLDDAQFLEALTEMVTSGQIAAEDIKNIYDGLGYDVQVEFEHIPFPTVEAQVNTGADVIGAAVNTVRSAISYAETGKFYADVPYFHFTKKGGNSGGHTFRSNTGGSGGGSRGSGGKGGKGKGGKGSSPKAIKPKEKKEHEKDYYEEVNSQLGKTEKVLSRIEKEEDRLVGDKARANQNKQLALLQKEIKLNEEKLKINKQELKDTDEKLKQQDKLAEQILRQQGIQMVIPNPVFDEDGVIANYEQISKALDDAHNELVKKYNAAAEAGNQELTEQLQEQMDSFDKYSKSLLDSAKRHNALQSEIEETTNALEELKNTIEDIQIAAYKASQEALDDLIELKKDAAEFQKTFRDFDPNSFINSWSIDDTPYGDLIEQLNILENVYGGAEETAREFYDTLIEQKKKELAATKDKDERAAIQSTIDFYNEQKSQILPGQNVENSMLGLAMKDLERLKGWINGTNTESNPFGKNAAALKDAYKDAYERVKKLQEDFDKTVEAARDARIKLMEQQADEVDYVIDGYDRVLDRLEKVSDTYTLYYGEDSYNDILKIMQQQGDIMQIQLNQSRVEYNRLLERYQEALENGDKATIKAAKELLDKAEDRMLDNAKELADHWVKVYEKSIDASLQKMTDTIWGKTTATVNPDGTLSNIRLGLEDLQTQWELEKQYMEDYKDEVEKAYEIDKLRNKYIDLLNDAQGASLGTQNKIRQQMQEQLDSLKNQTTLSEYDVKLANAKLEVLQKQIALEDAQRNKNKMQLRRDTQGNYRYVYRADEGDVKQAQDELLDSSFDAYELTKNQTITNSDRAVQLYQDMLEKMDAASKKYQDDQVAREATLQKIAEQYSKMFMALGEDFDDVTKGMYEVLCWNVENSTNETSTAAMDMLDALYDKNGQVKEDTGIMYWDLANTIKTDVIGEIDKEANNTILDIDIAAKALESNLTDSMDIIGSNIGELNDTLSVTINRANDLKEANDNLFDAFKGDSADIKNANAELAKYQKQLEDTQNSASSLAQQLRAANQQIATLTAENLNYRTRNTTPGTSRTTSPNGNTPSSPNRGTNPSRGTNPGSGNNPGRDIAAHIQAQNQRKTPTPQSTSSTGPAGKRLLMYYDTGGYTGEWGSDGRLALLHEKELVLNAKDTKNILDAVGLMRNMVSIIQIDALGKTLKSNINNASKNFGDTIEQRVEISATFPNVTNSNEIETALLGLSDKAYQYSYRTR